MEQALGEFRGTERYEVLRRIGEGGMGVVYEAYDRERQQRVALKTIRRANSDTIYRLKREFRALADLSHPNLVSLYDLVVDERACFFTMELVEGQDLLSYVASKRTPRGIRSDLAFAHTEASIVTDAPLVGAAVKAAVGRVTGTMVQLVPSSPERKVLPASVTAKQSVRLAQPMLVNSPSLEWLVTQVAPRSPVVSIVPELEAR